MFCAVPSNTPLKPGATPIPSAGPYYVQSYTPGQGAVLVRNPNYRGSRPQRFARIEVAEQVSNTRAVADVEAGTADYTSLITSPNLTLLASRLAARYGAGSAAAARGQQRDFHVPSYELDFLFLNTHRPLFSLETHVCARRSTMPSTAARSPPTATDLTHSPYR